VSRTADALIIAPRLPMISTRGAAGMLARPVLLPAIVAVVVLGLWEALILVTGYPRVIVPAPSDIAASIFANRDLLWQHSGPTVYTAVGGFLISTALGVALAIAIVSSRTLRDAVFPSFIAFQIIPKIALAPIFVLWFGTGIESRLAFTVFISFFPILIATSDGLETVERSLLRLCQSLNATGLRVLVHVRLPTSIPFLLSGMKIGITMAIIGVIIGEFISSRAGLGYLILNAAGRLDTSLIMASIAVLCFWGLLLYGAVEFLDRVVTRWTSG
jgi:NitT/TauT family transport system permease protein